MLVSAGCALQNRRKLAVQAAYILVPASRVSTGRGILPSYLGLCWCTLGQLWVLSIEQAMSCFFHEHLKSSAVARRLESDTLVGVVWASKQCLLLGMISAADARLIANTPVLFLELRSLLA